MKCGRHPILELQAPYATAAPGHALCELQMALAGRTYHPIAVATTTVNSEKSMRPQAPGRFICELQHEHAGRTLSKHKERST